MSPLLKDVLLLRHLPSTSMDFLPQPRLARSQASVVSDPSTADPRIDPLVRQVLQAYGALPFKGPVLELIPGVIAVKDMWLANLTDEMMERADIGYKSVESFSLESWLKSKVENEGTPQQKAELANLLESLPPTQEQETMDDFYSNGLPTDVMDVMNQPLREVLVYRSVDNIAQTEDDEEDTKEEQD